MSKTCIGIYSVNNIASEGSNGDGPHLVGPAAFDCWPAVVETTEFEVASALSSFSFKLSVPCSDTPIEPQLQVGCAGQMLALSWPGGTAGYRSVSDNDQCSFDQPGCDASIDTDDSDAQQPAQLRQQRQGRAKRKQQQWQVGVVRACEHAATAEAKTKAAARDKEVSILISQSRVLVMEIGDFAKAAWNVVGGEALTKGKQMHADVGHCALQLHAVRGVNLNPEIAVLRRARLLLLRIMARPDSEAASTVSNPLPPASPSEPAICDWVECLEKRPEVCENTSTTALALLASPAEQPPKVNAKVMGEVAPAVHLRKAHGPSCS